ncbi:MAG: hypothetical protein R3F42_12005 [Pseudomonadota bacterium]
MDRISTELDCESILQMLQERPENADAILEMIADLDEVDESCIRKIMEMQLAEGTVAA